MADSGAAVSLEQERTKIIGRLQEDFKNPATASYYENIFVVSGAAPESAVLQNLIQVHLLDINKANDVFVSPTESWSAFMNDMSVLQALVALVNDIRHNKPELLKKQNPEDEDFKECVFRMHRLVFLLDPRFQTLAQTLVADPVNFVVEPGDEDTLKEVVAALDELNAHIKTNGDIGSPIHDDGALKFPTLARFTEIKIKKRNTVMGAIRQLLTMRLPELRTKALTQNENDISKFYKYIRILNRIEILMHNVQTEVPIISWNGTRYSCDQGDGRLQSMNCKQIGGGSAQILNIKDPNNAAFVLNPVDYSRPSGSVGPGDAAYGTGTITCSLKSKRADGSIKPWTCHPEADEFAAVSYLRTHSFDFYKATTYHLNGRKPRALYFRSNPLTTIEFDKRRLENLILSVYQDAGDTLSKEVRAGGKEATYNVKDAIYPNVYNRAWKCLVHMTGCLNHQEFVYVHNTNIAVNTSHTPMCSMSEVVDDKPDLAALDLVFKKGLANGVSDPTNLGTQFIIIPFGFFVQHEDSSKNYGHSVSLIIYKKTQLFLHDPNGPVMSKKAGLKGYSSPQCIQELAYNGVVDFLHRNCSESRAKTVFSTVKFPFSRDIFWCKENIHGEFGDLVATRGGVCEAVNSWQMSIIVCNPWMDRDLFQRYVHDRRHQWTASIFPHSSDDERTAAFHVIEKLLGIFKVNEDIINGGDLDIQGKATIRFVSLEDAAKILASAMTRLSIEDKKDALMRLLESPNYTSKQLSILKDEKAIDDALKDGIMDGNNMMQYDSYGTLLNKLRFEDFGEYESLTRLMGLYAVQIYEGGEAGDPDVQSSAVKSYLMNNMAGHMEALRSWYQIMAVFEADIDKGVFNFSNLLGGLVDLHFADGTKEQKDAEKRELFFKNEHICGKWTEVQIFMWMQYIQELHTRMFEFPVPEFKVKSVPITSAKTVAMIEANAPDTNMAFTEVGKGLAQHKAHQTTPDARYAASYYIAFEDSNDSNDAGDGMANPDRQRAFVWSSSLGPITVEPTVFGNRDEAEKSHPTRSFVQANSNMLKDLFDHAAKGTQPPTHFMEDQGLINEDSPTILFMPNNTKAIVAQKKKTPDWRCNTIIGVSSANASMLPGVSTRWPATLSNPVNVMSPFGAIPPPYNLGPNSHNIGFLTTNSDTPIEQKALIQMAPLPAMYDKNAEGKKVKGSLYNNSVDCLFKTKRAFK